MAIFECTFFSDRHALKSTLLIAWYYANNNASTNMVNPFLNNGTLGLFSILQILQSGTIFTYSLDGLSRYANCLHTYLLFHTTFNKLVPKLFMLRHPVKVAVSLTYRSCRKHGHWVKTMLIAVKI